MSAADTCQCPCGCARDRRRGYASCGPCGRPAHRAAVTWAAPIARAFGLTRVVDTSDPDGIATNADIRKFRQSRKGKRNGSD